VSRQVIVSDQLPPAYTMDHDTWIALVLLGGPLLGMAASVMIAGGTSVVFTLIGIAAVWWLVRAVVKEYQRRANF
jgi:hypothetical protein